MQRISLLLQKLAELSGNGKNISTIDVDLMLDYTRVMYADLLELRKNMPAAEMAEQPATTAVDTTNTPASEPETIPETSDAPPTEKAMKQTPLVDIRTRIGINDKYLFLTELFGEDRQAYDNAINELNKCASGDEALKWLDEQLLPRFNWDKENSTVQAYYELVSSAFSSI